MPQSRSVGPVKVRPYRKNGIETGQWSVDVPASLASNGKRKRKLFDNYKLAMDAARQVRDSIDPITGLLRVRGKPSSVPLEHIVAGWIRDEEQRVLTQKKRRSTLETDCYRLRPVIRFFRNDPLSAVTEEGLVAYQAHRLKNGIQPTTINSELVAFGLVLKWAVKKSLIPEAPKVEQIPVRRQEVIVPTPEEIVRIIDHMPVRLKPLIWFLAETGCRPGEGRNLTWDCVDLEEGLVEIRSREGWTPKTQSSERRIPLTQPLIEMLSRLPREGDFVFPGSSPDRPIGLFRKAWATAVAKARLVRKGKPVHVPVKSLRKAHATRLAERNVNESVLQSLMGHARGSRVTRQYYVHASDEAKRAAIVPLPIKPLAVQAGVENPKEH